MLKSLYLYEITRLFFLYGKYVLLKMFKNIWKKESKKSLYCVLIPGVVTRL